MALNKVEICGLDTSKLPKITQSESRDLLSRIKAGDNAAREEFIGANLRLVLSIIQRFSGRGEQMDDLFQVGCIGLIKAIDNFDINLQVRFSTYAVPMIIGELRRYLRDNTALRVSRSIRDTAYKALKKRTELMDELSREPKLGEIAKALDMKEEDVAFALEAIQERRIIELRFFHGRTQMEVAEEIGISQAQVSRLEKNALKSMRKYV